MINPGLMRWGRLALALALSAVLIGCETVEHSFLGGSAPTDVAFVPEQQTGAVIVGYKYRNFVFSGGRDVNVLELWTYDPGVKRLIPPEQGGKVIWLARGGTLAAETVVNDIRYSLQLFPAGDYYLTTVQWGPYGRTPMAKGSIAFSVKPDTVTYIGNMDFKTPLLIFQDVDLVLLGRDNAAAQEHLAKFPNLPSEIWHQTLEPFRLDCNLEDGLEACYRPLGS